jgi:hypothetical protein
MFSARFSGAHNVMTGGISTSPAANSPDHKNYLVTRKGIKFYNYNPLIVTAFSDIGRGDWDTFMYKRSRKTYYEYFEHFSKSPFEYVYYTTDDELAREAFKVCGRKAAEVVSSELTYFRLHEKVSDIVASTNYKILTRHRPNPEFTKANYTLAMFNKMIFVRRAFHQYPNRTHYIWLDFVPECTYTHTHFSLCVSVSISTCVHYLLTYDIYLA